MWSSSVGKIMGRNEQYKQQAAEYAVQFVESGMVVGLGGGSTASYAIRQIGHLLRTGHLRDIWGIPCSKLVEAEARDCHIPLTTLEDHTQIDLTIDGADEIDPAMNLIKGGGGALTREKIVAQASRREIIIADETKCVPALGTTWAVPVEVVLFGWGAQQRFLESLGATVTLRRLDDNSPFISDQGGYVLDAHFGLITNPAALADTLKRRTGIIEHGLFIGLATEIIIAGADGIRHRRRA
jgi:ribose 5-phosphate isomerase A